MVISVKKYALHHVIEVIACDGSNNDSECPQVLSAEGTEGYSEQHPTNVN